MKAVLISVQPKWCELIASGKKTVEVRKTKPKIETPFKCYIYETQGRTETPFVDEDGHVIFKGRGQVIGEFVCDNITKTSWYITPDHPMWQDGFNEEMCLTDRELFEYSNGDTFYEWHISDLVIYDEPKALSEFYPYCDGECTGCKYLEWIEWYQSDTCMKTGLKRPPQSYMYVEELR